MAKCYLGRLYPDSIDESRINIDKGGNRWINISVIILDKPDQFDNDIHIQHRAKKSDGGKHIVIGNAFNYGDIDYKSVLYRGSVPSKIDTRAEQETTDRKSKY